MDGDSVARTMAGEQLGQFSPDTRHSSKCGVPGTVFFFPRAICFDGSKMLPHSNFSLKTGRGGNGDVASYVVLSSICANLTLIEDASLHRLSRDRVKVRHK